MLDNSLGNGLNFMLIGMGTVFAFLILMVIVMNVAAVVCKKLERFFPEPKAEAPAGAAPSENTAQIAAVIAAVKAHIDRQG